MLEELRRRGARYADHMAGLSGIPCSLLDVTDRRMLPAQTSGRFCAGCRARCDEMNTHLYGCNESYRWNGKYIYYCRLGLVFVASPLSDETGLLVGGLVMGPLIMGDPADTLAELPDPAMHAAVSRLPALSTAAVNDLAEVLCAVTAYAAGMPHSHLGPFVYEQQQLLNALSDTQGAAGTEADSPRYLIDCEKQLCQLIGSGDKAGAQKLLNEVLGYIYVQNAFDLAAIRARVVELIVLLSRATIDAGADMREILLSNVNYIEKIEQFTSLEELSVWITGIMHRFISYAFDFRQVKHSDVVYKVMEYVKAHFDRKLTLEDIAGHVYLSRSYLSSVFKEETGKSLFTYINAVRVERSKRLLLDNSIRLVDVAGLCGFEDQSYFTKVFKRLVGVSPKRYRDSRGRSPEPVKSSKN